MFFLFSAILLTILTLTLSADEIDQTSSTKKIINQKDFTTQTKIFIKEIEENFIEKNSEYVTELKNNTGKSLSKHYDKYIKIFQNIISDPLQIKECINKKCDDKIMQLNNKNTDQNHKATISLIVGTTLLGCMGLARNQVGLIIMSSLFSGGLVASYFLILNNPKAEHHIKQIEKIKKITHRQLSTISPTNK